MTLLHIPFLFGLGIYTGSTPIAEAQIPATALPRVLLLCGVVFARSAGILIARFRRRVDNPLSRRCSVERRLPLSATQRGKSRLCGMAMVAVYEDWVPFLWGLAYVVLTHGYFGTIDPSRVYNHAAAINNPWAWGLIPLETAEELTMFAREQLGALIEDATRGLTGALQHAEPRLGD